MTNLAYRVKTRLDPTLGELIMPLFAEALSTIEQDMLSLDPSAFDSKEAFVAEYASLSTQKQTINQLITLVKENENGA